MLPERVIAPDEEAELTDRARAGDVLAFERLLRAHGPAVFSFLVRWIGDRGRADDIFQETSLAAFRGLAGFRPGARLRPWLFTIAVNQAKKHLRGAKRRVAREQVWYEQQPTSAQAPERGLSAARQLERGLSRVAPEHRQVLLLRFSEDLSHAEIAAVLGVPEFVVKMRVSRARRYFARALDEGEGGKP
jgi:RNA polymerase sigma-70 factor, ECF subfamily